MSEHARIWFEVGRFLSLLIRSSDEIMESVLKHEDSVDCLFSLVEAEWAVLNTEGFFFINKFFFFFYIFLFFQIKDLLL